MLGNRIVRLVIPSAAQGAALGMTKGSIPGILGQPGRHDQLSRRYRVQLLERAVRRQAEHVHRPPGANQIRPAIALERELEPPLVPDRVQHVRLRRDIRAEHVRQRARP